MLCLEISINGKIICVAGSNNINQLQATITQGIESITPYIAVNGVRQTDVNLFEYLEWLKQPVSVNDVVTIQFVECEESTRPVTIQQIDKTDSFEESEKRVTKAIAELRELKKKPDIN